MIIDDFRLRLSILLCGRLFRRVVANARIKPCYKCVTSIIGNVVELYEFKPLAGLPVGYDTTRKKA